MKKNLSLPFLTLCIASLLAACQPIVLTPSVGDIQTAIAQTQSVLPTNTLAPTNTPPPPPTATPEPSPIHLSGSGDDVVDLQRAPGAALIHIRGNAEGKFFAVTAYGANGEIIDMLVNTNAPYDGIRPLDFYQEQFTTRLEIKASGDWEIEISGLNSGHRLIVPGEYAGSGDDVLILTGATPDVATIQGNENGGDFIVTAYGAGTEVLINTSRPYNGKLILNAETKIIEIKAQGPWKISITAK